MERFVRGDVVVLPFPYTVFLNIKRRPAVVLSTIKGQNVILAQITTRKRSDENLVGLTNEDFSCGFLKCNSFVMISFIFTVDASIISYKIGELSKRKVKEIEKKLCNLFSK